MLLRVFTSCHGYQTWHQHAKNITTWRIDKSKPRSLSTPPFKGMQTTSIAVPERIDGLVEARSETSPSSSWNGPLQLHGIVSRRKVVVFHRFKIASILFHSLLHWPFVIDISSSRKSAATFSIAFHLWSSFFALILVNPAHCPRLLQGVKICSFCLQSKHGLAMEPSVSFPRPTSLGWRTNSRVDKNRSPPDWCFQPSGSAFKFSMQNRS